MEAEHRFREAGFDVRPVSGRRDPNALVDEVFSLGCDLTVLCVPEEAALIVAHLLLLEKRVLDASPAFRFSKNAIYGMHEIYGSRVFKNATLVANPGCYAQGVISLLLPVARYWGKTAASFRPSVSGIGGSSVGGKPLVSRAAMGLAETALYGLDQTHPHVAEIHQWSGFSKKLSFFPVVTPAFTRGMCVWTAFPKDVFEGITAEKLSLLYSEFSPFARISHNTSRIGVSCTGREDLMGMTYTITDGGDVVTACLSYDNLGAGSAGRLVKNAQLMLS